MGFFENGQFKIFLCFFWLGLVFALVSFLISFFINKTKKIKFIILPVSQIILVVATYIAAVFMGLKLNYGIFRFYMLLGFLLGAYICYKTICRLFAKYLNFVYNAIINKIKKWGEKVEREQNQDNS